MLEIFFYTYLTSILIFSSGIYFSKNVLEIEKIHNVNLFQIGLYGVIFLSFLALIINFFYGLNKFINTAIFIFFYIYLFFFQKQPIKRVLVYSIFISILGVFLLSFETTYRPDAGLYHLPYTNILNNEKIIIGLSNIHFRYGHTSIIQYLAAINNNFIFNDKGILIPLLFIFSCFLLYLILECIKESNKPILFFNYIIISFICLKLNRYSDFGNDAPAHIFYFFLISIALKNFKILNKSNVSEMFLVSAYVVFNKITLFLGSFAPILILLFKKKIYYFKVKFLIFLILFSLCFFLKNFMISGCFAFPIEQTCIKKVFWYDIEEKRGSNAKVTMLENEAWTKGWSDQRENRKNFEEYLSNLNWVKLWSQNHGKRTLKKLLPFLFFLSVVSLILFLEKEKKKIILKNKNYFFEKRIFFTLLFINILGSIMWFFKFPVFRYGSSYLISSIAIFFTIVLWNKLYSINIFKLRRVLGYFTFFLLIVLLSKNSIRVIKNYNEVYSYSPWPKIYSETENQKIKSNKPIFIDEKFAFFSSNEGLCYYNSPPCTHMLNSQFNKDEIKLKSIKGYKVFYFLR